jgi:hypothetical protein
MSVWGITLQVRRTRVLHGGGARPSGTFTVRQQLQLQVVVDTYHSDVNTCSSDLCAMTVCVNDGVHDALLLPQTNANTSEPML